jgi:hypothetical protein
VTQENKSFNADNKDALTRAKFLQRFCQTKTHNTVTQGAATLSIKDTQHKGHTAFN